MLKPSRFAAGLTLITVFVLGSGLATRAQVKPGDFITPDNATKVKQLVPPGVYYKVVHGMTMKIIATQRVDWPPPYKEATEKYSAQVRLSADHRTPLGYVAGQPFPLIDPNDPFVATKIMWNNAFRPELGDDYDLRYFDCESTHGPTSSTITYIQVGHYAGYNMVGRTEVEPVPTDPDFKHTGRLWLFGLYPILAPAEARGEGLLRYRYADPRKADDQWSWSPGSRRLRRLNEAMSSSATGAQTWNPDHYSGFNAKTEEFNYRYLGEKQMLACVNAEHSPEIRCATDGGASACPEVWEMRHLYLVEATPRREVNAQGLQGKHIIYMDSEMWWGPYIDEYDRRGQLWYNHIWWNTYRDRPVPDSHVAIYPFKRQFSVATESTDIQSGFATMCYLPGHETPERECWYISMGAVDKEFFTPQAMVKAAQTGH